MTPATPMPTLARPTERQRQAALMRRQRAATNDLTIPAVANPRRRRLCQRNPALFLSRYFPHIFYNPFTTTHREMIAAFTARLTHGGRKAEAGPRGDGKTSLATYLAIYALVYALRRFVVIVGPNQPHANQILDNIRVELETNDDLARDFPEMCTPIRALEGSHQRADHQTVHGVRTRLKWRGDFLVFPTVAGSTASGAILTCRGIDGALRGMNVHGIRPDLVILDDPETDESARSEAEITHREKTIETSIAGLAGPDRSLAILYLCTLWARGCLADRFTDPNIKPAWAGRRHQMIIDWPPDEVRKMWDRYVDDRRRAQLSGDETGRAAHAFYLANRQAMDAGSRVSNPYRFDSTQQPDGSALEASALQFCFDMIADIGEDNFGTEYQNKAPEADAQVATPVDIAAIMRTADGRAPGTVPAAADWLTAAIDVGARAIHWIVLAWKDHAAAIVDYGVERVLSPLEGRMEDAANIRATRDAVMDALLEFRAMAAAGWPDAASGEVRTLDICLVDVGYARAGMDDPVYQFCRTGPKGVYRAAKGLGTAPGMDGRYRPPPKRGPGKKIGLHWYAKRQPARKSWLFFINSDFWKSWVHSAFLSPPDRPGSLRLPGSDPVAHRRYAEHITAEIYEETYTPGKGWSGRWRTRRRHNHWFDCTYNAVAAAAMAGLRLITPAIAPDPQSAPHDSQSTTPAPQAVAPAPGRKRTKKRGRRIGRMTAAR